MTDEKDCTCGLGPGYTCHPDCPAYRKPPPAEISGRVTIENEVVMTREQPALKSSLTTVAIATTDTYPQALLGQDNRRKRAVIVSDAFVIIGKQSRLSTGATTGNITGFRMIANVPIEIQNQDELYVIGTGVAANVSVLNERWS